MANKHTNNNQCRSCLGRLKKKKCGKGPIHIHKNGYDQKTLSVSFVKDTETFKIHILI